MNTVIKAIQDLTPEEYRACYSLNFGQYGWMRPSLSYYRKKTDVWVIMLWEDKLIGWSLVAPCNRDSIFEINEYAIRRSKYVAQFYVRFRERGKGYGRLLMSEVLKLDPRPHVIPHDTQSGAFFSSYPVTCRRNERPYITEGKKRKAA